VGCAGRVGVVVGGRGACLGGSAVAGCVVGAAVVHSAKQGTAQKRTKLDRMQGEFDAFLLAYRKSVQDAAAEMIGQAKAALNAESTQWVAFDDVKALGFGTTLPTRNISVEDLKALVKAGVGSVSSWRDALGSAFMLDPDLQAFFEDARKRLES